MRFFWLLAFAVALPLGGAVAAPSLMHAISGDEVALEDGSTVKLTGVRTPDNGAKEKLDSLIAAHTIVTENTATDRYGRISAQAYAVKEKQKIWLQGELLREGLAFVYPPAGDEARLDEMLKLEDEARHARRGIWAEDAYADIPADKAKYHIGHFGFVSGKVVRAERIKNKVYLNFGADWHDDFTIAIAAHDLRNFRAANIDPLSYEGKTIRVRGWIKRDFGPMVTVTAPSQITSLPNY